MTDSIKSDIFIDSGGYTGATPVRPEPIETPSNPTPAVVRDERGQFASAQGKRRRGGQPLNTNRVSKPWRSLWLSGRVPDSARWVLRQGEEYEREMRDGHLAGQGSFAEQRLVNIAATSHMCAALILAAVGGTPTTTDAKTGAVSLSPALADLPKFLKLEASALQALGLAQRSKPSPSLRERLAGTTANRTTPEPSSAIGVAPAGSGAATEGTR